MKVPKLMKAFGLPIIMSATALLALLTGVVGYYAIENLSISAHGGIKDEEHYAAMSGIQYAMDIVTNQPKFSYDPGDPGNTLLGLTFNSTPGMVCQVWIYSRLVESSFPWQQAPDGTWIPVGCIYVVAQATMPGETGSTASQITALCTPTQCVFNQALFGADSVNVTNNTLIDWFSNYPYTPPGANPVPNWSGLATNNHNNPVGTGTPIQILSGSNVTGNCMYEPLGNSSEIVVTAANLTGSNSSEPLKKDIKLDSPPKDVLPPPGYGGSGDFTFPAGLTTLQPGKSYQVNGTMTIPPGANITVAPYSPPPSGDPGIEQESDACLFVQNNVTISGTIDPSLKAETVQIFIPKNGSADPGHLFTVSAANVSCVGMGPTTAFNITSGANIIGAFIGTDVSIDNSTMHYDTTLANRSLGPPGWQVGGFNADHHDLQSGPGQSTSATSSTSSTSSSSTSSTSSTSSSSTSSTSSSSTSSTSATSSITSSTASGGCTMLP